MYQIIIWAEQLSIEYQIIKIEIEIDFESCWTTCQATNSACQIVSCYHITWGLAMYAAINYSASICKARRVATLFDHSNFVNNITFFVERNVVIP